MKGIVKDAKLVAKCGLYCAACDAYLKGHCPGCNENVKASWCKVRTCCIENSYSSCGECRQISDPDNCRKFNNFISRTMGLILNSNRRACIDMIKASGLEAFAEYMTENRLRTIPRRRKK